MQIKKYTRISSHPGQIGHYQENKQQQMQERMKGEKESLYTVDGNQSTICNQYVIIIQFSQKN
jgi:hypothetical protein